jgi:hypothetical protein
MKTKNLTLFVGLFFMLFLITATSCKKDEADPVTPPAAYVPVFSATSLAIDASTIDFYITCVTDDYELVKVEVIYPGGLGSETFTGPLMIVKGSPITFPNYFTRMSGNWTFRITGTIKSGTNTGTSFVATTSVSVSGK